MVQYITGDTPIYQLSVNQLMDILSKKDAPIQKKQDPVEKKYIYGLAGLQKLVGCSRATALNIKKSGKIPFTQIGRKIIFDADAVLTALNKK